MALDTRTSPEEESIYVFSGLPGMWGPWAKHGTSECKEKGKRYFLTIVQLINVEKDAARNISDIKLKKIVLEAVRNQIALIIERTISFLRLKIFLSSNLE